MRIKTQQKPRKKWWLLILILIPVYLIWGLKKDNNIKGKADENTYFCDAEKYQDGEFITPNMNFKTRCEKTTSTSYSGNASCKCGEGQRFAMIAELQSLMSFDTIKVSVAAKNSEKTKLRFVLSSANKHYFSEDIPASKDWGEYENKFIIPLLSESTEWKIYVHMATGTGPAYFDNFGIKINKFENKENYDFGPFPELELQINTANFKKIKDKRTEAMKVGLLFSSQDDLVNANIRVDSMTMGCKVRLKGDLLDHLYGDKWSYRIELRKAKEWRQMKKFSVHYSKARSHIAEWVLHQMMRKEGIISPKYDFFRLRVNKKDIGIFAYEHHFENEMLTENNRLIAPIIKHNDDGYWNNQKGVLKHYNWAPSSQMELFNKENDKDASFVELYQHGHNQLYHFFFSDKKAEEVFDLDKMAKYYALIEVGHGTHAQLLTNIRFYVNPISGLLEPIGYDFYSRNIPKINEDWRPIGQWENGKNIHERSRRGSGYMVKLFGDSSFYEMYLGYVEKFTDPKYLEQRFEEMEVDIKLRNNYIRTDSTYKDYIYDFFYHLKKAQFTRGKLFPLPNVALKSFRDERSDNVHLQSFHYFPLEIIGYNSKKGKWLLEEPIIMNGYSPNSSLNTYEVNCKYKPIEIIYQTLGIDSIFYHKVGKNIVPQNQSRSNNKYVSLSESKQFQNNLGNFIAMEKTVIINRHYKISKEESVNFPSGTKVQFKTGGSLYIEGKISAVGSPNEPVEFIGNNAKGAGLVLTKSRRENEFNFCLFNNLSAYSHGALKLDAAINIDESKVKFENCRWKFTSAPVDVKLNNSEFTFYNCSFEDNAGSAIHSFYSVGKIVEMDISKYGKEGIKQRGGNISGENIRISNLLGTAISINDFAHTSLWNLEFVDCHNSLQVSNHSEVSITGYRGKAEFRDIQVTGDEKPYCKILITKAEEAGKLSYIVSPNSRLSINNSKKKMK